jgi:hypothetical protein
LSDIHAFNMSLVPANNITTLRHFSLTARSNKSLPRLG